METSTAIAHNFALHLVVDDVDRSITWYQEALGATVTRILRMPDGSVATADLDIDGLTVAVASPVPGTTLSTPSASGTSVAAYRLTTDDADASMRRALAAGATPNVEVHDEFWGVRTGEVLDPSGHRWAFDQPVREVSNEEIEQRLAELVGGH
jgi:PhnB protein